MAAKDPERRRLAGRIAAYTRWAGVSEPATVPTPPGAWNDYYRALVDPSSTMPERERAVRAWRLYQRDQARRELRFLTAKPADRSAAAGLEDTP